MIDPQAEAERWSPVIYQDVADGPFNDASLRRRDLLSQVDFDGDWDAFDNAENLDAGVYRLPGTVYYDVVETETHIYIVYAFFHAIDWADIGTIDHENDMEHAWLVIEKHVDGTETLLVAHTQAHGELFGWSDTTLGGTFALSAGGLSMEDEHVRLFIEAHGHGPASCSYAGGLPFTEAINCAPSSSEDLVLYHNLAGSVPSDLTEPDVSNGGVVEADYALVPAHDTLWPLRASIDGESPDPVLWDSAFDYVPGRNADLDPANDLLIDASKNHLGGEFAGDEGGGGGLPPWGYAVKDNWTGGIAFGLQGDMLLDPAALFDAMYRDYPCTDREPFWNYLQNPYLEDLVVPGSGLGSTGVDAGRRCDGTVVTASDTGDSGGDSAVDSGVPTGDTADQGEAGDSGATPVKGGSCGCASEGGGAGWLAAFLALAVGLRRRTTPVREGSADCAAR